MDPLRSLGAIVVGVIVFEGATILIGVTVAMAMHCDAAHPNRFELMVNIAAMVIGAYLSGRAIATMAPRTAVPSAIVLALLTMSLYAVPGLQPRIGPPWYVFLMFWSVALVPLTAWWAVRRKART